MRTGNVQPTGVERHFGDDEFIVSKTDTRGMITYANDVFLRVSGWAEQDLLGKPHNIIRHPDMPRSVFRLLWSTIQQGEEIFAYVLNLARDGAHYWVFAHVTPSFGANGEIVGYHSNRRSPEPRAVAQADALYRALRQEETRHSNPAEAIDAGVQMLTGILHDNSVTYDEWVWDLTATSMGVA